MKTPRMSDDMQKRRTQRAGVVSERFDKNSRSEKCM